MYSFVIKTYIKGNSVIAKITKMPYSTQELPNGKNVISKSTPFRGDYTAEENYNSAALMLQNKLEMIAELNGTGILYCGIQPVAQLPDDEGADWFLTFMKPDEEFRYDDERGFIYLIENQEAYDMTFGTIPTGCDLVEYEKFTDVFHDGVVLNGFGDIGEFEFPNPELRRYAFITKNIHPASVARNTRLEENSRR